ncbi:hypothetical protein JMUB6875_41890 [Nocardia sp. JMUB6875]
MAAGGTIEMRREPALDARQVGGEGMCLKFLGKGGSQVNECPSLYATESGYLVQGWSTDRPDTVEIPHLLLGFLEPRTFLGSPLTDTGRGTFTVIGRPITDADTLGQLDLAEDEAAIEVPKMERTFYGAAAARRLVGPVPAMSQ